MAGHFHNGRAVRALILSIVAASLMLAMCSRAAAGAPASVSPVYGASQAICTPSPCLAPTGYATYTLGNVSNDDGTTSTRAYAVYRPGHLLSSAANLAPAVLVFYSGGTCGFGAPGRWATLAAAGRFAVVAMEVPCGRDNNWDKRNVDTPTEATPNDEPYVAAVVHDITQCPFGAGDNQCIDPQRIYAVGFSSGGTMAADIMCDVQNSTLFRGYLIDSASVRLFNGAPDCPSQNQDYFVMLALGNTGPDARIYYGTAPDPHLNVPQFADWSAGRLGCAGARVDDALGSPVASTLRYTYFGPCAFAAPGSQAVVALGIQNGGHGWGCQDSDPGAAPYSCPGMSNPPGLTEWGTPMTNGLYVEASFWNFATQSASLSGAGQTPGSSPAGTTTGPDLSYSIKPTWIALGDGFSSGDGNPPYLAGSGAAGDHCHRARSAYPYLGARALGFPASALSFHACAHAKVADFSRRQGHHVDAPQLRWVGQAASVVSVTVGWQDASLPQVLGACARTPSRCRAGWGRTVALELAALAGRSGRDPRSLYRLYRRLAAAAPHADVIALGYPRMFPAHPPPRCRPTGTRLTFSRGSMRWINALTARLDGIIQRAAAAAHVSYPATSLAALAGHESCTRGTDVGSALYPNAHGQRALARLVERTLWRSSRAS